MFKLKLRALRVNKGLSAKEVADLVGVRDHKTVLAWENGKHKVPYAQVLKLAEIYDCRIDQIDL